MDFARGRRFDFNFNLEVSVRKERSKNSDKVVSTLKSISLLIGPSCQILSKAFSTSITGCSCFHSCIET